MELFKRFRTKPIADNNLLILYGTKSGNAKLVAQQTQKYFEKNGVLSVCKNMSGFDPTKLTETQQLLIVISTHGEGQPPPTADQFFNIFLSDAMAPLHQLSYSICALGDSSYQEFCWAGKVLDKRFAELGAKAFQPRMDCDIEFSDDAVQWIKQSAWALTSKPEDARHGELNEPHFETGKINNAVITQRTTLTNGAKVAPVFHLVMQIDPTQIQYNIGDSIAIVPENPHWLVEAIIQEFVNKGININDAQQLKIRLTKEYELTSLSNKTVHDYAKIADCEPLNNLLQNDDELSRFLAKANVFDLLKNYHGKVDVATFLNLLPKLKSRKYSIASSQKLMQNELHLTIKTIRYEYQGLNHEGSASVYANEYLPLHSNVSFRICSNESFQLPQKTNTPIIMIGVSTGIAPFRAMLQEREAIQVFGNAWLIWGNKYESCDFLYRPDLVRYKENGNLEKLTTVFSCDKGEIKYIHEILLAKCHEILDWLTKGAHIYVCGSLQMAHDVKHTLIKICTEFEGKPLIFEEILDQQRYHEDAY